MADATGRLSRIGDGALGDALRYLLDLGWDTVYRRPAVPAVTVDDAASVTGAPESAASMSRVASAAATPSPDLRSAPERAQALALVAAQAKTCERCELARGRTNVVFASGDPDADLMIIGEGPGAQEDRQGLPFVGPAGELLTKILLAIDRTRDQVYIANIVKCRPPQNRDPRPEEVAACRAFLDQQIALVQPSVIVALGRVAAQTLLGNDYPVSRLRGTWWEVAGVPVRVTYHPAALLRDANLKRPTWEDMKIVRERLRETASV
jgi:uracil-DNA glycosylase